MNWVRRGLMLVIIITTLAGAVSGIAVRRWLIEDRVFPGVQLWGHSLAGFTATQVEEKLSQLPVADLVLKDSWRSWSIARSQIDLNLARDELAAEALSIGRGLSWSESIRRWSQGLRQSYQIEPQITWNQEVLVAKLMEIAAVANRRAIPYRYDPLSQEVWPGRSGRRLNTKQTIAAIQDHLLAGSSGPVELVFDSIEAINQVAGVSSEHRLMRYSTYFDATSPGRVHNIKMSAGALHGIVIAPGEEFSFNQVVGPLSADKGYEEGLIIINQEFVPGIGGGVCQVSSTLYNAALLAGMTITERQNHSRPVSYLSLGRDAAVYYDTLDFCFKNPFSFPVVLGSEVVENRLSIAIYGNRPLSQDFSIRISDPKIISPSINIIKDDSLAAGVSQVRRQGQAGYQVTVERLAVIDGKEHQELISQDIYPPISKVIAEGV